VVGFGAIGRAVTRRARGFDCKVLAFDPAVPPEGTAAVGAESAALEDLFTRSDFVTLHAALTPDNRGMIGEDLLRRMKPSACFINAARGPLVDEEALVRALAEGWIAGAAVDAFTEEPLSPDHPLRRLPNCIATPHSAFNTVEVAEATNRTVAEQVLEVLAGGRPRFALNPEVFETSHYRSREPLLGKRVGRK
jgi:phosphoglycerate dehydrogenase-like enzyme